VTTILERVTYRADGRVVIDCPRGAGPDAAAPLAAATGVVLVSTACAPALRDATKTAAMARALGCRIDGFVLTRTRVAPPGVESLVDCPALGTVPDVTGEVLDADRVRTAYASVAARLESESQSASKRPRNTPLEDNESRVPQ
jgi:septum site-determining protein MinD